MAGGIRYEDHKEGAHIPAQPADTHPSREENIVKYEMPLHRPTSLCVPIADSPLLDNGLHDWWLVVFPPAQIEAI